jgi:hypothetical protein
VALDLLREELRRLGLEDRVSELAHGGSRGFDAAGEEWAAIEPVPVRRFPSDWFRHGDRAGPIRNSAMVSWLAAAPAGTAVAFWDPRPRRGKIGRRGTADTAYKALRAGCRVVLDVLDVSRATKSAPRLWRVVERYDSAELGAPALLDRLAAGIGQLDTEIAIEGGAA